MELVRCCGKNPSWGKGWLLQNSPWLPRASAKGQEGPGKGWMGRLWAGQGAGKGLLPLPTPSPAVSKENVP